jgi:hypothetical protein
MTEIPMTGPVEGTRPREVTIAANLVLLEAIVGLIAAGVTYWIWEDELSLLGIVLAIVAFWLYTMILKQDYSAWMITVIFNILAVFLYATGYNWAGVALSLICFIYLISPNVKVHFEK